MTSVTSVCSVSDLVKHVVKEYRNIFPEIMKSASKTLDQVCFLFFFRFILFQLLKYPAMSCFLLLVQVFGLKLVEIDNKNHLYILISKLENVDGPHTR